MNHTLQTQLGSDEPSEKGHVAEAGSALGQRVAWSTKMIGRETAPKELPIPYEKQWASKLRTEKHPREPLQHSHVTDRGLRSRDPSRAPRGRKTLSRQGWGRQRR